MPPIRIRASNKHLTRTERFESEFLEEFLESQLKSNGFTDCNLICDGVVIPAHSVLLEAVSPFFRKCFEAQGGIYLDSRDVILCDFTYSEIKHFIQLLYTGSVNASEEDIEVLQETLKYFGVENRSKFNLRKATAPNARKEIRHFSRSKKKGKGNVEGSSASASASATDDDVAVATPCSGSGENGKTPIKKSGPSKRRYQESDWEPLEPDTDEDAANAKGRPSKKAAVAGSGAGAGNSSSSFSKDKKEDADKAKDKKDKDKEESEADEKWEEPDYSDKEWFEIEAKRCQFCKKTHEHPSQASMCITGHSRLRCYFCFKVCSNTEKLFEHFKKQHKQAGRENSLLCPYCDQTIPYKSVSCHVISMHLPDTKSTNTNTKQDPKKSTNKPVASVAFQSRGPGGRVGRIGRPPTCTSTSSGSGALKSKPAVMLPKIILKNCDKDMTKTSSIPKVLSKEDKIKSAGENGLKSKIKNKQNYQTDSDGLIRAGNLDMTIQTKGIDGKMWSWRIQKDYSSTLTDTDGVF